MSKGKKNGYTCQKCNGQIVTIDIDDGVTPFAIACRATKDCDGLMYSAFYSIPQFLPAQYEWFKPKSLKGYGREMKEHIRKGGLDMREIQPTAARR